MTEQRVVCWFSCGAPSAVAAKLAIETFPHVLVVHCDTLKDEHPDNRRFKADVERWLGQDIVTIRSAKYESVDSVFVATRYMSGIKGARCTTEMKKIPRFAFQLPDDLHLFGFTVDEGDRIVEFKQNNPELFTYWILAREGMTRWDCITRLSREGISPPAMYELGFANNNCIGCVKSNIATVLGKSAATVSRDVRKACRSVQVARREAGSHQRRAHVSGRDAARQF